MSTAWATRRDRAVVVDVEGDEGGLAAAADGVDSLGAVGDVGDDHPGALGGEQLGGDPAEPGRGARDQGHLAVQPT